jgi:predicted permease
MHIALSVGGIYLFILLGWLAKLTFKEQMHERTLVLFSIYFLQPILVFWGLTSRSIDLSVVEAPLLFAGVTGAALLMSLLFSRLLFHDQKDRSIATVASIVGNTGNLGIPLGIALFGEASVIYTSIINMANVFLVNTVGVYFYSRGNFSIRQSLLNIFRLPPIWFGFGALLFNYYGFSIPADLQTPLKMGAYATMVIQLAIFGMYLYSVEIKKVDWRLFGFVTFMKFVAIPLMALLTLHFYATAALVYNVVLLELIVPLAVMNVNLAALYACKPTVVTFLVFSSSVIFAFYIFLILPLFRTLL